MNRKQFEEKAGLMIRNKTLIEEKTAENSKLEKKLTSYVMRKSRYVGGKVFTYVRPTSAKRLKTGVLVRNMRNGQTGTDAGCHKIVRESKIPCPRRGYIKISDLGSCGGIDDGFGEGYM